MEKFAWHKQTTTPELEVIDCPPQDPIKDFRRDPTGAYVLVRCDRVNSVIETAVCDKHHVIIKAFRGRKAQDIYNAIFAYQKRHQETWISTLEHASYLGKELNKAQAALSGKEEYIQE